MAPDSHDLPVAVAIDGLHKAFGAKRAVDGLSLEVPAGTFFGVVGPNGAGKSTTLKMSTGLLRPDTGTITVDVATGVRTPLASAATLRQNYPNPFTASTEIEYTLPERASIALRVYDVRGRVVATLDQGSRANGPHRAVWDGTTSSGRPTPTGIYFYRLESGTSVLTRKLVVLR